MLEAIDGKFLRHSPEFHQWRIADRLAKIKAHPDDDALYDDLAVSYAKVGRLDDAIATMTARNTAKPKRYETLSNLGTFYMMKGEWAAGLPFIDEALTINPDAHFGREKYQAILARYVRESKMVDGKPALPLNTLAFSPEELAKAPKDRRTGNGFLTYVDPIDPDPPKVEGMSLMPRYPHREAAIKAVVGMLTFADYQSPILLEVLGDLLCPEWFHMEGGGALTHRAYLAAAQRFPEGSPTRAAYLQNAEKARSMVRGWDQRNAVESAATERRDADDWFEGVRAHEMAWIAAGDDPEKEFAAKYYDAELKVNSPWLAKFINAHRTRIIVCVFAGFVVLAALNEWLRQRRRAREA